MNSPEGSSYLQIRIVRISIRVIDYGNNKMQPPFARRLGLTLLLSSAITACGGGSDGDSANSSDPPPSAEASLLSAAALLGQKIFSDKALSVSGQQSCASCHVAQYAFTADPTASGPGNVNTSEIPYNRPSSGTPALSPDEIDDLITFLCTLTDGYDPSNPNAQVLPAQCSAAVAP